MGVVEINEGVAALFGFYVAPGVKAFVTWITCLTCGLGGGGRWSDSLSRFHGDKLRIRRGLPGETKCQKNNP